MMSRLLIFAFLLALTLPVAHAAPPAPPVEQSVQIFLDAQPGPLKTFRDGDHTAAEWIQAVGVYYGISPRITLALLEATNGLLSTPAPPTDALSHPFSLQGPDGFGTQIDWAAREVRSGFGPYQRPPVVSFTDGTTLTLTLAQAPEGVAVQRFLAHGRTQPEWRVVVDRFGQAFRDYFNNELPEQRAPAPAATAGFLQRPWPAGTRVSHLAYFDHMYPTVDTNLRDNGFVVNFLGRGNVQYDGHDGHDFFFPDQPIGTHILAAADGIAFARTHRGNGVFIEHANGYVTVYWHLDKFATVFKGKVDTDQGVRVKAGDLIGASGKSGFVSGTPHLHFEVRHNGREVDPYGWYGPGSDPCVAYSACEASRWLWSDDLRGEFDFSPPGVAPIDRLPPIVTFTVNPTPNLLLLAHLDSGALQAVGTGTPLLNGTSQQVEGRFGAGLLVGGDDRLAYPTSGNLSVGVGTVAFWAKLPERFPVTKNGRVYLVAASAHADEAPVYTDTLALRRESSNGAPRWDFWTTPARGDVGRNDLVAPDTLKPGWHHFALAWDRAAHTKALYLDGILAASASSVELPDDLGPALEFSRFAIGMSASGAAFDELALFGRALDAAEIARLADAPGPLRGGSLSTTQPDLQIDLNATDNGGAITGVQLSVNGAWGDPQPYVDTYSLDLPHATGTYTVGARVYDRANNSTTVSTTITLLDVAPLAPMVLETLSATDNLLHFFVKQSATDVQVSRTPDFADAVWQPIAAPIPWTWLPHTPRVVWIRFRAADGTIDAAMMIGPDVRRVYIPMMASGR